MTLKQPSQILSTAKIRAKKKISETIGVCLFGCYQAIDTEFISMDDTWAVHSVRMEKRRIGFTQTECTLYEDMESEELDSTA